MTELERHADFTVTDDDTAAAVGSGSLPVLGTPRLLAWCEAATCAALEPTLPEGSTSVGTRISLEHLAASPVGQEVEISASTAYADGRLHRFTVSARHVGGGQATARSSARARSPGWSSMPGGSWGVRRADLAARSSGGPWCPRA